MVRSLSRYRRLLKSRTFRRNYMRCPPLCELLESRVVLSSYISTVDADFAGNLVNLNHDDPAHNQLQLNKVTTPFPFINIACSGRGTIARVNTETGQVLGEYWTAPNGMGRNPSRTTVDLYGNVWCTNRDEAGGNAGSVVKVGLVIGGTRGIKNPDGSFTPDPNGEYLKAPFQYNTCADRDADGLIHTSRGLGNILAWTNAGGADTWGGVSTAQDEAILLYVRLPDAINARHVSVDKDNNVWVGGYPFAQSMFYKLDGQTGAILDSFDARRFGAGGYGGLIDKNGIVWSASISQNTTLRYDPATDTGMAIGLPSPYGMGVDTNGFVWNSTWTDNRVAKISPAGVIQFLAWSGGSGGRGVAITPADNNVWIANSLSNTVTRLDNNGNLLATIGVGGQPTGVAVDAAGKVWVTNLDSNNTMRINPATNAVDLAVNLGGGASPYNYSDMTGIVAIGTTSPQGTWTHVQDGGKAGTRWGTLTWNQEPQGYVPDGAEIKVEARAAETEADLPGQVFIEVANGAEFSLTGRYIETRVTLKASPQHESPVFSDMTLRTANEPPEIIAVSSSAPTCGSVMEQKPVTVTVTFTDPDPGDTHTALIDWGDGATSCGIVTEPSGPAPGLVTDSHPYAEGGIYTITVTVTDQDGDSDSDTTRAIVSGAGVHGGILQIMGTKADDHVTINPDDHGNLMVHATFFPTNHRVYPPETISGILIVLCQGNDKATIAGSITLPATVFGSDGDDRLNGGGGRNILVGGNGDDMLIGGQDNDLLIGGNGADRIVGNDGDDILVSGPTAYDTDAAKLAEVLQGTLTLIGAAFDDDSCDVLTGSAGNDRFLFNAAGGSVLDRITDLKKTEVWDDLPY